METEDEIKNLRNANFLGGIVKKNDVVHYLFWTIPDSKKRINAKFGDTKSQAYLRSFPCEILLYDNLSRTKLQARHRNFSGSLTA